MSDKERERHFAEGLCLECHETGHISSNCPKKRKVKSTKKGKPPGVPMYGVTPEVGTSADLSALAEESGVSGTLSLAYIDFDCDSLPDLQSISDDDTDDNEDVSFDLSSDTDSEYFSCDQESTLDELNASETVWYDDTYEDQYLPPIRKKGTYGHPFRDAYASNAARILNKVFWELYPQREEDDLNICIVRTSDEVYTVSYWDYSLEISEAYLHAPSSDICGWCFPWIDEILGGNLDFGDIPEIPLGDALASEVQYILSVHVEVPNCDAKDWLQSERFRATQRVGYVEVQDLYLAFEVLIPNALLENAYLDLPNWYAQVLRRELRPAPFHFDDLEGELELFFHQRPVDVEGAARRSLDQYAPPMLQCHAVKADKNASPEYLQRNSSQPRALNRVMPEPVVVAINLNGNPVRALLDSGSLSDFVSTKVVHQLRLKSFELDVPLPVQMAVQGSRAKINLGCIAELEYQDINEARYFDVMNILNYDLILGTPFLFQHQVTIGLNPTSVVVGSASSRPIEGKRLRLLESRAAEIGEHDLERSRGQLREYARDISTNAMNSPLPPLRSINHTIPLIDEDKVYSWRPSKCPEALRRLWNEKRKAYLSTGRWRMTNARNTSPMLLLTKPGMGKNGVPPKLRTVIDLRQRNKNTKKLPSPLPDMEGILRRVSHKPFRSMIDGKDAYEHIRVEPAHVERTAMASPDGNMVSFGLQQGDCNAVATYQSLMNHMLSRCC